MPELLTFQGTGTGPGRDPRTFAELRVGDIHIDQNFQRPVDPAKIEKMGDFEYYVAETLTIVHRLDGSYYAIEGQHRAILLRSQFGDDATIVCVVLEAGVDEAAIAAVIARSRTKHSGYQLWQLDLAQGKELQVKAQAVLDRLGLEFSKPGVPSSDTRIAAVGSVAAVMRMGKDMDAGANLLDTTLSVIGTAFGAQPDMYAALLIKAVARIVRNNPGIDYKRLTKKLSQQPAGAWLLEAAHTRVKQPGVEAVGTAIVDDYNRNLSAPSKIAW